jgi:transketolase
VEPVLRAALEHDGPVYVRLERAPVPVLTDAQASFSIGDSLMLRDGGDATVFAIGSMVAAAVEGAEILAAEGIGVRVISMVSIKPLDEAAVVRAARETGAIVVAEDHNCHGGLGGAVAQALVRLAPVPMAHVAVTDTFAESGSTEALREKYHLTADDVVRAVRRVRAMGNDE